MESQPNEPIEHEGEKYLRLLGLVDMADKPVEYRGQTMQARDFLEICGEHARPMLVGFETLDSTDPRYEPTKLALQNSIMKFIEPEQQ